MPRYDGCRTGDPLGLPPEPVVPAPEARHTPDRGGERVNPTRTYYKFSGLRESADPFRASALSITNWYHLVTEMKHPRSMVAIVWSATGSWGWVDGESPEEAILNIQYASGPTGVIERLDQPLTLPTPLEEIVPIKAGDAVDPFADVLAAEPSDPQSHKFIGGRDAIPQGVPDPMKEFFECMRTIPGAAILTLLAPASDLEQAMAKSFWRPAFHGGSNTELQLWFGTPICGRSFLCADTGAIPARMRAERRIMSQRIGFAPVSAADSEALRQPGVDILKGFAVPYGVYRALVPMPAAGVGQHLPGLPTVKPPAAIVPLEPVPEAPEPFLRMGEAVTVAQARVPVGQSPADKLLHTQIIGKPGRGKTTLLANHCAQYAANGIGFVYLDPHGDGTRRVLRDVSPGSSARLWFVDHSDPDHIVPVNPLAATDEMSFARAISLTNDMLRHYVDPRGEGYWGERATRIFTMIGTACWHTGTVSLPMIAAITADQELCRKLAQRVEPIRPALARQLMSELGNLSSSDSRDLFSWMGSRLGQMLNSPALMRILGTGANAIDMAGIMDRGEGLLVDLGASRLGPDAVRILEGCYLIGVDLARTTRQRRDRPFGCVVDEAHTVQIGPLASLLDEGRKFGVFVEAAHQRHDQLERQFADALEADTGTFICLGTGVRDGARASVRLRDWPVADLTRMPAFQAAAVICRDGVTTEPFSLFIDRPRNYHGADADEREANAQRIADESGLTLSAPYAELVPVTPDNVRDILARPADRGRHARLAALRSQPVTRDAQLSRLASGFAALVQDRTRQQDAERLLRETLGAVPEDGSEESLPGNATTLPVTGSPPGSELARFLGRLRAQPADRDDPARSA